MQTGFSPKWFSKNKGRGREREKERVLLTTYPSGVQLMTSHFIVMLPLGSSASKASRRKPETKL